MLVGCVRCVTMLLLLVRMDQLWSRGTMPRIAPYSGIHHAPRARRGVQKSSKVFVLLVLVPLWGSCNGTQPGPQQQIAGSHEIDWWHVRVTARDRRLLWRGVSRARSHIRKVLNAAARNCSSCSMLVRGTPHAQWCRTIATAGQCVPVVTPTSGRTWRPRRSGQPTR